MTKHKSLLNSIKWAYTAMWGERGFSALFTLILAAMLGPQDFGILSIGLVYITFLQMFLDQGMASAIVQRRNLEREHLDSVFWLQLTVSLILMGCSIFLSRWWATVNHAPQVSSVIAALSVCLPIDSLALIPRALLSRDMDYKSLAIRSNGAVLLGGAIGIVMALAGWGVWALVGQQIVRELAKLVLLVILHPWRPRMVFSWKHIKELMGFSISQFVGQLAYFTDSQAGSILLGLFLGPLAVGLYRLAERLVAAVIAAGTSSIQSVSLPEFSRFQDDPKQLKNSVLTCIRLSSTLTFPTLAALAAVSAPLMALIGPNWNLGAGVIRILCVQGMFVSITFFTAPLLQALGKARLVAVWEWCRTGLGLVLLAVAGYLVHTDTVRMQITAVGLSRLALGALFVAPVFVFLLMRHADIRASEFISSITPSVVSSLAIVVSALLANMFVWRFHVNQGVLLLAGELVIAGVVGIFVLLLLDSTLRAVFFKYVDRSKIGAVAS